MVYENQRGFVFRGSGHLVRPLDDDDEIAYFNVRWKTSLVYRTKNHD